MNLNLEPDQENGNKLPLQGPGNPAPALCEPISASIATSAKTTISVSFGQVLRTVAVRRRAEYHFTIHARMALSERHPF